LVEVMGRWSNLSDQGERLQALVEMVPSGPIGPKVRTPKQRIRHLDLAAAAELVAGYEAGATIDQLATQFQIHADTVTRHLKRAQVPRRYRPLTDDQVKTALELCAMGQSLAMVGEQLGCHGNTVRLALIRAGVARRDSHGQEL
jgi:hypothetical protein